MWIIWKLSFYTSQHHIHFHILLSHLSTNLPAHNSLCTVIVDELAATKSLAGCLPLEPADGCSLIHLLPRTLFSWSSPNLAIIILLFGMIYNCAIKRRLNQNYVTRLLFLCWWGSSSLYLHVKYNPLKQHPWSPQLYSTTLLSTACQKLQMYPPALNSPN